MHQQNPSLEIERKFLIEYPDENWLAHQLGSRCAQLSQTYLVSETGLSHRVRSWTEGGVTRWFETSKRAVTDITREETEREITEEEYRALLRKADPERQAVEKTRWCIPYKGHILEIDLYPFWHQQAVLECELQAEDEAFSFPTELRVLREVTSDPRYLNSSLARAVPQEDGLPVQFV